MDVTKTMWINSYMFLIELCGLIASQLMNKKPYQTIFAMLLKKNAIKMDIFPYSNNKRTDKTLSTQALVTVKGWTCPLFWSKATRNQFYINILYYLRPKLIGFIFEKKNYIIRSSWRDAWCTAIIS